MEMVTEAPLDLGKLFEKIRKNGSGSVLFHYAVAKSQAGDKASSGILFEPGGDVEAELAGIAADVRGRWNVDDILLVRRIGTLKVGDVISLVAVSFPTSEIFTRSGIGQGGEAGLLDPLHGGKGEAA